MGSSPILFHTCIYKRYFRRHVRDIIPLRADETITNLITIRSTAALHPNNTAAEITGKSSRSHRLSNAAPIRINGRAGRVWRQNCSGTLFNHVVRFTALK